MLTIDFEKLATYQMGRDKGKQEGKQEGRKEGREEGREEGAYERAGAIAQNLLAMGLSAVQVAAATGLPLAGVEGLRDGKSN